jgi:hypothetical protein
MTIDMTQGDHVVRSWGTRVAVAAVLMVSAASCGSDDSGTSGTAAPPTTVVTTDGASAPATEATEAAEAAADTTVGSIATDGSEVSEVTDAPADGPATIAVPTDQPTIQDAVDVAKPGDLILVSPGVYHEAVDVTTDGITIRGLDRAGVVLDGEFEFDNGIRVLGAKGVVVENMTARNYTKNGFFWTGVEGFRGAYLTALRNGDYGIYVFDSMVGTLEHVYGSGSPDAGVYVGECYPCQMVLDDVLSEHNGLGYSGTNSGGDLYIVNSEFRYNRAGIVPNSGSYELCYPERETTIVGNLVYSNNQGDTPAIDVAILAMGNGILSAGGVLNDIERNLVYDHDRTGIGLVPFLEDDPNDVMPTPDQWTMDCATQKQQPATVPDGSLLWDSQQNRVIGNVVSDSRGADLAVASAGSDLSTLGNCFAGNTYSTTAPAALETIAPCDADQPVDGDWETGALNVALWLAEAETMPPSVDYQTAVLPDPPALANMPDAATAPAAPAYDVPAFPDLDAITVPAKPA